MISITWPGTDYKKEIQNKLDSERIKSWTKHGTEQVIVMVTLIKAFINS